MAALLILKKKPNGDDLADAAELVLGLLVGDPVDGEAALHVVDQPEVLVRLLQLDHVHEAARGRGQGHRGGVRRFGGSNTEAGGHGI